MLILGYRCESEKSLSFALQAIQGVNDATAKRICALIGVAPGVKLKHLRLGQIDMLNKVCRDNIPRHQSRRQQQNIKALVALKHYRGVRHMFGHPCRGQGTRTNASTAQRLAVIKSTSKVSKYNRS